MKKVLIKSLIATAAFEIIGVVINLISFAIFEEFLIAIPRSGGEWRGCQGFGMMLSRYYGMESPDWPGGGGISTRIEFDLFSLILALVVGFSIFIFIFSLRYRAKKKKESLKGTESN